MIAFMLLATGVFGQDGPAEDSTQTAEPDTGYVHSPKKAIIYSAVLPGLGQLYNDRPGYRKWWKVPIIYGALGASTYAILENRKTYVDFRDAYILRVDGDSGTDIVFEL